MANRHVLTLSSLEEKILDWLKKETGSANEDLMVELVQTLLKLDRDKTSRGDIKILSRSLKELRYAFKVFAPYRLVRKVSMYGSTRVAEDNPYYQMAVGLGRRLGEKGYMVITGAGTGIMQGGHEGAGREHSFGVNIQLPFAQKANRFIQNDRKLMTFHFFFTRKVIFVKETDGAVFFPGGFGTHDEAMEALTLAQTGKSQIVPILFIDVPGQGYWREWEEFIRKRLLRQGYISDHDMRLYKIVEDLDSAIDEFRTFYSNYHSYRFVNRNLVMRLTHPPSEELIENLNLDFKDILTKGRIRSTVSLREEADDSETLHLPRLLIPFNRNDYGRLRELIDRVNTPPSGGW